MRDQKQQNHNQQKKIALVNDFTGFGRCSIAVQLPVISMMKVQCCAVLCVECFVKQYNTIQVAVTQNKCKSR